MPPPRTADRTRSRPAPRLEALEAREVPAEVGALDPSFGAGGLASLNVGGGDGAYAAVALGDGRVVVAGFTPGVGGVDFLVERVNPDGSLDPTFGTGGRATIDFGGGSDAARAVALDPAGNILVGGKSTPGLGNDRVAVARLTPNGMIDATFGLAGRVILPAPVIGQDIEARSLLPEANGGVVVAGTLTAGGVGRFTIGRLTSTGAIDPTFGTAGNTTFSFGFLGDRLYEATRDAAGNIVLVGETQVGAVYRFAVARLTPGGVLDGTFGIGGKAWFNLAAGTSDSASAVAVDAAGRLVIAGTSSGPGGLLMGVARLNGNGAPDGTFGTGGVVRTGAGGGFNQASSVVIQPGGRIVLGGITGGPAIDFAAVGLTPTGALDPAFNPAGPTPGATVIDFGGTDIGHALVQSADGRLVVAGTREAAPGGVELARLIGDVEKGTAVAAGGVADGTAALLDPTPAGALPGTPTATLTAFGGPAVNVRTAVADVNGDEIDDVILITGPGTPLRVAVVSGADNVTLLVAPFDPFGGDFAGGGFVSAGDFDHDGRAEFVVSPDVSGGPRVTVFSRRPDGSTPVRANFFGIDDPDFRGGARTAVGDVDGDGTPDLLVAAGFGGGPRVAVFRGASVLSSPTRLVGDFFAFPGTDAVNLRNGAFVAAGDVTGDGFADLAFGGGPGGAPRVFLLSGALVAAGDVDGAQAAPVSNFFVGGNAADRGGVRVAVADLDGDTRAEVVAGSGEGVAAGLRAYLGKNLSGTGEPATFQDLTLFGGTTLPGGVFVG
ncbi:FG-GAP-like repeat-containing protein [Urbifossiella limnaea]|uniref:FG-GAP repeat protein n=1 Tax=Urbifossiella limnaea TaxID=2528023 RepID=A0A517Y2D2_9BACT|nr:FG-GAP-like repeat-containing protein [Urbifossiella limnaea]QDU23858.1 FG-GAP repeat protein [Urbifossiella limnaea]